MNTTVVDTNILVRYLIKDDPEQTAIAKNILESTICYVPKTVILELVWVMASKKGYALSKEVVIERLKHLLGLPTVYAEELPMVVTALKWYEFGLDFADALHLTYNQSIGKFATFDLELKKKAQQLNIDVQLYP